MEKLKNLLNEYEGSKKIYVKWNLGEYGKLFQGNFRNSDLRIISKSYGFIKWLVENDKIKKDLISRVLIRAYVSPKTLVSIECEFHDYYESLLMILSISDTPIDDLVSILK